MRVRSVAALGLSLLLAGGSVALLIGQYRSPDTPPNRVASGSCSPPAGFVDLPAPTITPAARFVSHTEEIDINRSLHVLLSAAARPLKDTIQQSSTLPGVSGDYSLTKGEFGTPGTRRLVCLSDGSTLEEMVLERETDIRSSRFRYIVWNYTSEKARAIDYGVGEFHNVEIGGGRTHVTWTYSFQLNEHRFPGYLGGIGRFLFRVRFLDREYASMMRDTLRGTKIDAERYPER